jgi:hypothetical protein
LDARSWKSAAAAYLSAGGQLLAGLQSEAGTVLTEQALAAVAATREGLEKADAAYNTALDKLEVGRELLWQYLSATCTRMR